MLGKHFQGAQDELIQHTQAQGSCSGYQSGRIFILYHEQAAAQHPLQIPALSCPKPAENPEQIAQQGLKQ